MRGSTRVLLVFLSTILLKLPLAFAIDETLEDRIKPVGTVCVEGDSCSTAKAQTANTSDGGGVSPETTYNTYCVACHGTGVGGAPMKGEKVAWNERLGKGFETVVQNATKGINAMPAKGMCMSCSDDDIVAAIKYMADIN